MAPFMPVFFMLLFHQSNRVSAIMRMLYYYRRISIFVFFHVFVCSLLLSCMLESTALRVGEDVIHEFNITVCH